MTGLRHHICWSIHRQNKCCVQVTARSQAEFCFLRHIQDCPEHASVWLLKPPKCLAVSHMYVSCPPSAIFLLPFFYIAIKRLFAIAQFSAAQISGCHFIRGYIDVAFFSMIHFSIALSSVAFLPLPNFPTAHFSVAHFPCCPIFRNPRCPFSDAFFRCCFFL